MVELWAERSAVLGARPDIAYVLVFENRGPEVGRPSRTRTGRSTRSTSYRRCRCASCDRSGPRRASPATGWWPAWTAGARGCRRRPTFPYVLLLMPDEPVPDLPSPGRGRPARDGGAARRRAGAARPPVRGRTRRTCCGSTSGRSTAATGLARGCTWRSSRRGGRPAWHATWPPGELGSGVFFNPVVPEEAAQALREAIVKIARREAVGAAGADQPGARAAVGTDAAPSAHVLQRPLGLPAAAAPGCASSASGPSIEVPGLWTMQGFAPPQYTNVQMPFDDRPPNVPDGEPDRHLPAPLRAAGPDGERVVLHFGGSRGGAVRRAQRRAGRHPQGRAHARRVRRDASSLGGRQRAGLRGRPVVRRELHRGPGPVVARRPAARRVPVRDAARAHRRRVRPRRSPTGGFEVDARRRDRACSSTPTAAPVLDGPLAGPARGADRAGCGRPRRRTSTRCASRAGDDEVSCQVGFRTRRDRRPAAAPERQRRSGSAASTATTTTTAAAAPSRAS